MRVLIAVDGSANADQVFDAAAPWIRQTGSRAELLTVVDESEIHGTLTSEHLSPLTPQGVIGAQTTLRSDEPRARVAEDRTQALARVEGDARLRLEKLAEKHLPRVEYAVHVIAADDAAEAILSKA